MGGPCREKNHLNGLWTSPTGSCSLVAIGSRPVHPCPWGQAVTAISHGISKQVPALSEQTRWAGRASATYGVCSLGIEGSRPGFHWQAQRGGQEGSRKRNRSQPRSSHCSLKLIKCPGVKVSNLDIWAWGQCWSIWGLCWEDKGTFLMEDWGECPAGWGPSSLGAAWWGALAGFQPRVCSLHTRWPFTVASDELIYITEIDSQT